MRLGLAKQVYHRLDGSVGQLLPAFLKRSAPVGEAMGKCEGLYICPSLWLFLHRIIETLGGGNATNSSARLPLPTAAPCIHSPV